jgi:pimeloyl-ACP methyl ester carboxylesterase
MGAGAPVATPKRHRGRRIALAVVGVVVALLAFNTVLVELDTEPAKRDIGRTLELPAGDVNVREDGNPRSPPLILIHGFQASVRWWDRVTPALAREHHVVRIDLLGHGASEMPRHGYSMEEQGDLVAQVMERLGIRDAPVVGHSMGGQVVTALAERHPELVDRLMVIGTAPENRFNKNRFGQSVLATPVIGHALRRVLRKSTIHENVDLAFADGTAAPEILYLDPERATYNSFTGSRKGSLEYRDERPLDERLGGKGIPVDVIFGSEDELVDADGAHAWDGIESLRAVVLPGAGHSPMVERPGQTARLIAEFARRRP